MPGSGPSQVESAMAHPIPAQPDTTRNAAIATLFNLHPRRGPGARLTSSNSLLTQTRLSKSKNAWLWAWLSCIGTGHRKCPVLFLVAYIEMPGSDSSLVCQVVTVPLMVVLRVAVALEVKGWG